MYENNTQKLYKLQNVEKCETIDTHIEKTNEVEIATIQKKQNNNNENIKTKYSNKETKKETKNCVNDKTNIRRVQRELANMTFVKVEDITRYYNINITTKVQIPYNDKKERHVEEIERELDDIEGIDEEYKISTQDSCNTSTNGNKKEYTTFANGDNEKIPKNYNKRDNITMKTNQENTLMKENISKWNLKRTLEVLRSEMDLWVCLLTCAFVFLNSTSYGDPLDNVYEPCLLGKFMDVQNWAMENGSLSTVLDKSISLDLSGNTAAVYSLRQLMTTIKPNSENEEKKRQQIMKFVEKLDHANTEQWEVEDDLQLEDLESAVYLSLARNNLDRIPFFYLTNNGTRTVNFKELRFLSFYDNNFGGIDKANKYMTESYTVILYATNYTELPTPVDSYALYTEGNFNWVNDLKNLKMPNILELDLRSCKIQILEQETFASFTTLKRLYLSYNNIYQIMDDAFKGLTRLVHLDLSYNTKPENISFKELIDGMTISKGAFEPLKQLKSLDFSFSKIVQTCAAVFKTLASSIQRLSVCYTKFPSITQGMFANTSLKYLDISGNIALEALGEYAFEGLENTLEILFANRLGIKHTQCVMNLTRLRILSMSDNDISNLKVRHFENLTKLEIIDLNNNRINTWVGNVFDKLKRLRMLRIAGNNLNLVTNSMLRDLKNLSFISLGRNSFVCNCLMKQFVMHASEIGNASLAEGVVIPWKCSDNKNITNGKPMPYETISSRIQYQHAHRFYRDVIGNRVKKFPEQDPKFNYDPPPMDFNFLVLDYLDQEFLCTDSWTNKLATIKNLTCNENVKNKINTATTLIISLVALAILVIAAGLIFWKRYYIKYFLMMIKNVAILSVVGKETISEDQDSVFVYDVFVSYCDEDRQWVLDKLLPEVEKTTPISICLHERDFQVGLSILENIISCMDRSRTLMMVVSSQFLLSHWCQFEMHLAQHRLIETRREQLILVLLEDIPRRRRPTTLHYLMRTKTYIVWPKDPAEIPVFWKRLKKALLHGRNMPADKFGAFQDRGICDKITPGDSKNSTKETLVEHFKTSNVPSIGISSLRPIEKCGEDNGLVD